MATSASYDFSQTALDLITDAYVLTGIAPEEEPLEAYRLAYGLRALNKMFKDWQGYGLSWRRAEGTITAVAGQASYTLGTGGDFATRPVRLTSVRFRNSSSVDMDMWPLSASEYDSIPVKTTQGTPNQYFYDPALTQAKLYVWPVLATGQTGTFRLTYAAGLDDFDASSNDPAVPQEHLEAVTYALALRLNNLPGGMMSAEAKAMAIAMQGRLLANAGENASIFFQPEIA